MDLAKPRVDIGLATNDLEPMLAFWQVAAALRFLHARDILHGDVKPANILLDGEGRAGLAGFGRARLRRDGSVTHDTASGAHGTPAYMDPALLDGSGLLTEASDVYSFGILAWEVLAGRRPPDEPRTLCRPLGAAAAPLRSARREVPWPPPTGDSPRTEADRKSVV